ncbi:MAG: NUDIX hydrolase [bacterium]|nr:NUDIX hydrolase [bacterium]
MTNENSTPCRSTPPQWLRWARALQALSQTGLHFGDNPYDRERYEQVGVIAAEILAQHTSMPVEDVLAMHAREHGYATPKVDVRGAVFRADKILLVRETLDNGRWTLPGGWADVNETPAQAVVREIREEAGFDAVVTNVIAVYDRDAQGHLPPMPYHVYKLFFLCALTGGAPCDSHETSGAAFFAEDALPELSQSRTTVQELQRCFAHYRQPSLATEFD